MVRARPAPQRRNTFHVRSIMGMLFMALAVGLAVRPALGANCAGTSTSLTPLNDLGARAYRGFVGGLYLQGSNAPPPAHASLGATLAGRVAPRLADGRLDPAGRIVFLSIGMSNTQQEFARFLEIARADPLKKPSVILVNAARGGQTAEAIKSASAPYWGDVDRALTSAGVARPQVQAVWLKEANAFPTEGFPGYAQDLRSDLREVVKVLKARFPNLWLVYLSSRTYGGYASTLLNPEAYAYESGFAVKWLIQDQIEGRLPVGAGSAPWLGWGPYLWADGERPRLDGATWSCGDFRSDDGTHPSTEGRDKVAHMLLDFLHVDPTARTWWMR